MQKRQAHKSAIAELFSKTYTKKKISISPLPGKHFSGGSHKIYKFSNKF